MRSHLKTIIGMAGISILAAVVLLLATAPGERVEAATSNVASAYDVQVIPIILSGQRIATTADVVQFKLPFPGALIGVSATARASGGTTPTLTIDVQDDGVTVLSAPISITAATVSEGVVTTTGAVIADESEITIDLTITGTSPTWDDITVLLTVVRT